jgi:cytidine deaminase
MLGTIMDEKDIIRLLTETKNRALALYSNFKVGALITTKNGKYYSGHNIESSSYGLTICAERVAIFKALSEGERDFKKIYILSDDNKFCPPCGACRQVILDYAPGIEVILATEKGKMKSFMVEELLPEAFQAKRLLKSKK